MPPRRVQFVVEAAASRVDRLVADATGRGRRLVRQWLAGGRVLVDGRPASGSQPALPGSVIEILLPDEGPDEATANAGIRVLCETPSLVVLDKPAGVHSERGLSPGSVAGFLEDRYGDRAGIGDREAEAGLLHRLDRDTSGVQLAARDRPAWVRMRGLFSGGATRKQYLALVRGRLERPSVLDSPLARRGQRMALASRRDDAIEARTRVRPLEAGRDWTLVEASMSTGAMHQVRVHLAGIDHPLLGDGLYGGPEAPGPRRGHLLHARRIRLGDDGDFSAPVPGDFLAALAMLRARRRQVRGVD